ncbi:tyrosinase [Nitrosomonas aestuarii]|uniref:Tyrosinase n=1 Tax=Nitrosomonas aestuarii TaxID=52441 RepID=A0A1I4G6L8_9PROT|nr:tyrosinase family protein [Nitrosomonas aestuarii]SFL24726.1 tyrosinase [Nitrosomonas aestuarii]
MTTVAKLNYQRKLAGLPLIRFDIVRLNPEDIQDLRDAYAAMYEISDIAVGDARGYTALARGHGYDQDLCHNDSRIFLTWHRSYVYAFEKALNTALKWKRKDDQLELTLPFWNWTQYKSDTHASNGIPKTIDDMTYKNSAGATVDNPLARAKSLYRTLSQGLTGEEAYTHRYPTQLRSGISQLKDEVDRYMDNPDFSSFSDDFNNGAHGSVHVWVGGSNPSSPLPSKVGDMRSVISAGYDPIFWLHHSMVDKVWFDWQALHPGVSVPRHVLDTTVYGGKPGSAYIDAPNSLRYIYSSDSVDTAMASTGTMAEADALTTPVTMASVSPQTNKEIPLGTVTSGFARAQLDFFRLHPPKESFEVRAYVDNPNCNADSGYDDPSYAGRMVLFGHGVCHGAPGHCNPDLAKRDAYDIRSKHPLRYEHTSYCLDVTRGLRNHIGRKKSIDDVKIYLVTVDGDGKGVSPGALRYEGCSLRTFG